MQEEMLFEPPELPADYEDWANRILDEQVQVTIGYKRKGNKVTYHCQECGFVYEEKIDKVNGAIAKCGFIPHRYLPYKCKCCGKEGTLENEGYLKKYSRYIYTAIAQKTEHTLYIRQFWHEKICTTSGACKYTKKEAYRLIIAEDKIVKKRSEYRYSPNGWERALVKKDNISNSCNFFEAHIYRDFNEIIAERYPYLDINAYLSLYHEAPKQGMIDYKVIDIIETYARYHDIEMLLKLGYPEIVKMVINKNGKTNIINKNKKKVYEVLKIRPDLLQKYNTKRQYFSVYQYMTKMQVKLGDDDISFFKNIFYTNKKDFETITKYMSPAKAINRIKKYKNEKTEYSYESSMGNTIRRYRDYLKMRNELGYDMTNTVFLFPKNLYDAHQKMVEESQKRRDELYTAKMNKNFAGISKRYSRLKKTYEMNLNGYVFLVPQNAEDIILEGRKLHHCVGSAHYLDKHSRGVSSIIFMRYENMPEESFITIEINKNMIIQWYGKYDHKPEDEIVRKTIEEYEKLCCKKKKKAAV